MNTAAAARLLIVDDEPQILRALRPGLNAAGYEVESVGDANAALQAIASRAFDIIIVDLGLPDMDGKDLIARVREWSDTPIVVLSARDAEQEKISALDIGANDFVNKPFSIGELMARLRVVMRMRANRTPVSDNFKVDHLEIDFGNRRMKVMGKEVRPSPRELKLLHAFTQRLGEVLTHKQIVAAVWGADENIETQFVRVLIGNLRQKVEKDPARPTLIVTEPGIGYRMAPATDSGASS
jgi:two-component system KDP operon response regulator KdpE